MDQLSALKQSFANITTKYQNICAQIGDLELQFTKFIPQKKAELILEVDQLDVEAKEIQKKIAELEAEEAARQSEAFKEGEAAADQRLAESLAK